ncbi:NADH:flavin oxidoreductase [Paraburkholderia tropica]|nr:NADH:flavin oxidoreductase [Paraburkholderia tropica]RQN40278.1 NADH:flavin oxidoreductase [Paraburkholderia tropica]
MKSKLFEPLTLAHGPAMKNRFMLAPLTNQQSAPDGAATDYDVDWVRRIALGGYALVQTCAATVQGTGRAFKGQLGIHSDEQLDGLRRMADAIREGGALSAVQLHHAGHRARPELGGVPAPASDDPHAGLTAMTTEQVERLRDDFIRAAQRAQLAGFDGVAVHGAFGFVISEFLSPLLNRRRDRYGSSIENRARLLFEVIDGIRRTCGPQFQIGLRLSVERYGLRIEELRDITAEAFRQAQIDYLDLALWNSAQLVMDGPLAGRTMLSVFADLPRGNVRLGVAGKIRSAQRANEVIEEGADFVLIGRAAILNADFPQRIFTCPEYHAPELPIDVAHLQREGLSPPFINYMRTSWDGFVA